MKIRPVSLEDCPDMTVLTRELGYPSNSEKMGEILQMVIDKPDHEIFVAEIDDQLAGYVHLVKTGSTGDKEILDIAALMVDRNFRGRSIGDSFVKHAEDTAKEKKVQNLRIRTSLISPEAYGFFEHRGFVNLQTQEMFVKDVEY